MSFFAREDRGDTLLVTLDRPPLNALNADVLEEGAAMLAALAGDPPAGGVVLTGAGKAFTAGVDIKAAADGDIDMRRRLLWGINDFAAALYRLPCALVCAINGHAIGAGGIVSLAADWSVIADDDALKIGLPEAKAGLPFPQVPQIIMDQEMDPVWRRRTALSSELYSAARSIDTGLADELSAPEALVETAIARAGELQAQPAFGEVKANMRRAALARVEDVYARRGTK